ncbi:MAG: hypothetical protein M3394_05105 [Actinomycetota bacterium]|nr:hypothetical protein [Actinomycetota bacterium]
MRRQAVLSIAVLSLTAACGRESLPKLPSSAAGSERSADGAAAMSAPATEVTYRFDGTAPDLPAKAAAYELGSGEARAAVKEVAAAFGLSGEVRKRSEAWVVRDGDREVSVHDLPGLPWYLGTANPCPDRPVSDAGGDEEDAVSCVATAEAVGPPDQPVPPPAVPSREQVEAVARPVFERLGVGLDGLEVSEGTATVHPRVGGRRTVGYEQSIGVAADGRVLYATGRLGRPKALGDYPLVGLQRGLERLRTAWGFGPRTLSAGAPEPAIARDDCADTAVTCGPPPTSRGPQEVVLTGAEVGLLLVESHLVPAYLFRVGDGDGPTVVAVEETFLEGITPHRDPDPEPPDRATDIGRACSSMGSASVAAEGGEPENQPLQYEICGPTSAKAGEEVVFEVTVVDPDAEIVEEGCGGPRVAFGDEVAPVVGSCMPACAGPPEKSSPGKLHRTFRHTYEKAGRYTATFRFQSAFCTTGSSNGMGTHNIDVR